MKIIDHEILPEKYFMARLRETPLRGFGQPLIYKDAHLQIIEQFPPDLLVPPQRYVLKGTIKAILDLADAFEEKGVDIFALRGALFFWLEGMNSKIDKPIPFLPPIVEESTEHGNCKVMLVNDGMHRVYATLKRKRGINIVFASGLPKEYPYYASAMMDGWDAVQEFDELPDVFQKKEYRNPDNYKALFRQFNVSFPGVQEQRKQSNPSNIKG